MLGFFDDIVAGVKNNLEDFIPKSMADLEKLLSNDFVKEHTNFNSVSEFFNKLGVDKLSHETLDKLPIDKINEVIQEHTNFNSWEEMLKEAGKKFLGDKLPFGKDK